MFKQLNFAPALMGLIVCISAGCTQYEYDITRPPDLAMHVGRKAETRFARDPFEYRMQSADSRLVINIENKTDDSIQLLGDRSSVVDFNGQSHPLRSQAMAPHSFIRLILPPLRPTVRRTGTTFGIGVGTRIGDRRRLHDDGFLDSDPFDDPMYLTVVDDDNALFWDWSGEGQIRLLLAFDRKGETFTHEFVIARVKAN
jgi:hypothetical protein